MAASLEFYIQVKGVRMVFCRQTDRGLEDCKATSMTSCFPFYENILSHTCLKDNDFVTAILLPPISLETGGQEIFFKKCLLQNLYKILWFLFSVLNLYYSVSQEILQWENREALTQSAINFVTQLPHMISIKE